jgi:hypothetical protein
MDEEEFNHISDEEFNHDVSCSFNDLIGMRLKKINFSKGYPIFEELYNIYKDKINREEKKEFGYTEVILTLKK